MSAIVSSPILLTGKRIASCPLSLVCFPYAGANPYLFLDWKASLEPRVDVIGIHLPGRATRMRERSHDRVGDMANEVVEALAVLEERPFAFYGHSLGALVAFETARQLRRLGRPQPIHLFVGGARPPHMPALEPHVRGLGEQGFLDAVQARYGGIPAAIVEEPELLAMFLPPLRADFAAYETYQHVAEKPLGCPITAFAGAEDPLVTADLMEEWARHTGAEFDLKVLPGGHFFLGQSRDELIGGIRRKLPITV